MVFRLPKDDSTDYIKRVIGLPGDRIQMIDGVLNINGAPVKRERIDDFVTDEDGVVQRGQALSRNAAQRRQLYTLDLTDNGFYDNTPVYTVPPGHYFMMGDNRDNSTDSRVLQPGRYVPFENLIGRAQIIFFSIRDEPSLGGVALALGGALEPAVHDGAMSGRKKAKPTQVREPAATADAEAKIVETKVRAAPPGTPSRERRRAAASVAPALLKAASAIASSSRMLESALTHISALKGARNRASSYQRLEFLGDHVLGLVISDMLYRAFPKADEGELSRRLADLVRKETCAEVARAMDLGAAIRLGDSEANAGARRRPAILADVCEALIGARISRRRLQGGRRADGAAMGGEAASHGAAVARSQNRAAGMGASARPADARLSRSRALRSRPQSRIPRRRTASHLRAGRRRRPGPSVPPNRRPLPPCCARAGVEVAKRDG